MIYHITSHATWRAAQKRGFYRAPTLASEGFIHCSQREQVLYVANDLYADASDLLLLCIDECLLNAELRWEAPAHPNAYRAIAKHCDSLYPHLYGELNLDSVLHVAELTRTDGSFALPSDLP